MSRKLLLDVNGVTKIADFDEELRQGVDLQASLETYKSGALDGSVTSDTAQWTTVHQFNVPSSGNWQFVANLRVIEVSGLLLGWNFAISDSKGSVYFKGQSRTDALLDDDMTISGTVLFDNLADGEIINIQVKPIFEDGVASGTFKIGDLEGASYVHGIKIGGYDVIV